MRLSATKLAAIGQSSGFGNQLYDFAGQVPSLDQRFADDKSLRDAVSGQQLITHTRASSGTFVDGSGVLRTAVTNLALNSENFSAATWTLIDATVTTDAAVSPTGATTADALLETAVPLAVHNVYDATPRTFTTGTQSFYVKPNGRTNVALRFYFGFNDWVVTVFSLTGNGSVTQSSTGSSSGFSAVSSSIVNVGNGWYRISMTATQASRSTFPLALDLCTSSTPTLDAINGAEYYLGDVTKGVFIWGAQFETTATVGEYIPTTSTINSAPRFDHNPTTGESLGLLVEEQRTNSIRNNTMVGAVAGTPGTNPTSWLYATAQSNGLTISVIGTGVENGINYIDYRFNGTTVASPNSCAIGFDNGVAATGQTWTQALYWKLVGGSATGVVNWQIGLIESTSGGVFVAGAFYTQTAPTSAALINQRPTATRTLSGGATVGLCGATLNVPVTGNTAIDITLRIGLPQLEQGAFASSPILTSTAAATRSADVASITGSAFSGWYSQSQGTVYHQGRTPTNANFFSIDDGTVNNRITSYMTSATAPFLFVATGGVAQVNLASSAITAGSTFAQANVYKAADFAIVTNGGTASTSSSGSVPVVNRMIIGANVGGSAVVNGHVRRLCFWPTRLSNEVLQRITQ